MFAIVRTELFFFNAGDVMIREENGSGDQIETPEMRCTSSDAESPRPERE